MVMDRLALILPYNSMVSYNTCTLKVSSFPSNLRSFGTRHEYPQVPSQPKGITPSATFSPLRRVMITFGSSDQSRE